MSKSVYVFFGHGWDIGKVFDISDKNNVKIAAMKSANILQEKRGIKYMKSICNIGIRGYEIEDFIKELHNQNIEMKNEFCVYDSKKYNIVPDMLLTVYAKKGFNTKDKPSTDELTRLQKLGEIKATRLDSHVILLSELVEKLGNNFSLIIHACRGPLDVWQMSHLHYFEKGNELENIVMKKGIKPLPDDYQSVSPPCKDYEGMI